MRAAFGADLRMTTTFLLMGPVLYALSSRVNTRSPARCSPSSRSVAILSVNMLNHLAALLTATDPNYSASFGSPPSGTLPAVFLELHAHGYTIPQITFGLWLLPLGNLGLKSGLLPRWLSTLAVAACFSHLLSIPSCSPPPSTSPPPSSPSPASSASSHWSSTSW